MYWRARDREEQELDDRIEDLEARLRKAGKKFRVRELERQLGIEHEEEESCGRPSRP
jgi:hypothetical protein